MAKKGDFTRKKVINLAKGGKSKQLNEMGVCLCVLATDN